MAGEKRGSSNFRSWSLEHKRVKITDLGSVFRSKAIDANYLKAGENGPDMSQTTKETVTINSDASQSIQTLRKHASRAGVGPALLEVDLNAKVDTARNLACDNTVGRVIDTNCDIASSPEDNIGNSRGLGLDLNGVELSSSINHDSSYPNKNHEQSRLRDASECGSTSGPLEEKDAMKIWKEMKQNGFMSTSHGGIPIPKPPLRKNKADGLKKKMEIARKEQVDRFAKIAAPSGLLNGLNPGIINHVRNSKQVHSIIKALVRSDAHDVDTRHEGSETKNERTESSGMKVGGNFNQSGLNRYTFCREDGMLSTLSRCRQINNCHVSSGHLERENDSRIVEKRVFDTTNPLYSDLQTGGTIHGPKLSPKATMGLENISCLSSEESAHPSSVSSLSVRAAKVASQWLELLHLDIKGRLAALQRSKKRVQAVIQMELPLLICKEFSCNQEKHPYVNSVTGSLDSATADVHKARWSALFSQMETALTEEEKQLESWLKQVEQMHLHCAHGLSRCSGAPSICQPGTSENDCRQEKIGNDCESELAVRAAAAAFYSTCNFFLQKTKACPVLDN